MKVLWPWERLERGQGFFVPGLDVAAIRKAGLISALPYRYNVIATPGIRGGLIGVWFYRPPPSRKPPA